MTMHPHTYALMTHTLADWQAHVYAELGSVLAGVQEYEDPREIAARLEAIARDLKEGFSAPVIPTSSRAEINEIKWR
jgi:hypothetical protein